MKLVRTMALFVVIIGFLSGCIKDTDELSISKKNYPMDIGTEWIYDSEVLINYFQSETSDSIIRRDTFQNVMRIRIAKDTILNDTMHVTEFITINENESAMIKEYKFIDNEGLKGYAYGMVETQNSAVQKSTQFKPSFLINLPKYESNDTEINKIVIYENPRLEIKLPLEENSLWTYSYPTIMLSLQINKEVIGTESLNVLGKKQFCYKISYAYLYMPAYEDLEMTDWISEKGLLMSIIKMPRMTFLLPDGSKNGQSIQQIQTLTLRDLNLNN